ncbi:response regulator [Burkholderia metallica]|uniref:response regulator n=1 Tax=Burkholderia metallica TaxID=488729 RepID=UPI00157A959D|nr:response regulator [Burkholderia metallica]NTZ89083.1 response regulator [Burkholderia metallica]
MPPKIIIADDHPIIVAGIQQIVQSLNTFIVAGAARDGYELLDLLDTQDCDILVIDYSMPQHGGPDGYPLIEFIKRRYPHLKILLLTMLDNPVLLRNLDSLGIQGVVSKRDRFNHVAAAIDAVWRGAIHRSPAIQKILAPSASSARANQADLTAREFEVLRLFSGGLGVSDIAEKLNRSVKTISTQKISAMKKLGVSNDIALYNAIKSSGLFS